MSPPGRSRGPATNSQASRNSSGKDTHAEANATEPSGAALLTNALTGVEGKPPHWTAQCPMPTHHEDGRPDNDASLDIRVAPHRDNPSRMTPLVICSAAQCRAGLIEVCKALGLESWRVQENNEGYRNCKPAPPRRRLTLRDVSTWHTALMERAEQLAYLTDRRGLTVATIEEHWLGYDPFGRYTLPVWVDKELVNVRRYLPDPPPKVSKILNVSGHGTPPRLYPSLAPSGPVLVCEGEWDALVAGQHMAQFGHTAVTGTHGAGKWSDDWTPQFKGRHVAFVYDCDEAGRKCSVEHAAKVATVAKSVRVVDLDPARADKWDVSDWFSEGRPPDDLRALINATVPLLPLGRVKA